jgi:hypothetical protein
MSKQLPDGPEYAVCIDNSGFPASLELHKIYQVLPDADAAADGDIRIIDESGEDYIVLGGSFRSDNRASRGKRVPGIGRMTVAPNKLTRGLTPFPF